MPEDLPPHYFRAAGDPDEAEAEAPPSQFGRIKRASPETTARRLERRIEPQVGQVLGRTNAAWRRSISGAACNGIRRPRNIREAAVWSGWAAGGFVALILGFFFFVTWGMPSTDDLWEARQADNRSPSSTATAT